MRYNLTMSKILLTGFAPFLGQSINPSALIAQQLAQENPQQMDSLVLPVAYGQAFEALKNHISQFAHFPSHVILLGQVAGRSQICLERVALNWIESQHADESGNRSQPREIIPGAPAAFLQKQWPFANSLADNQVKISHSAGTYVCNELYFQMLHHYQKQQSQICFVHLPLLPEQVTKANPQPSLSLEAQIEIIRKFITEFTK